MEAKKPYYNDAPYVDDEYDDDFDGYVPKKTETFQIDKTDDEKTVDLKKKLNHKTDTTSFNSMSYEIMSPEEATQQTEAMISARDEEQTSKDYADPVLAKAVYQVEKKFGRKITYDEFDKLCRTYAAELANKDAAYKNNGEKANPIDYKLYYETLIQNKKVQPAYKMHMQTYENSLIDEIDDLLDRHREFDSRDIHVGKGDPINIRHKGKVYIKDEEKNREIIINNKKDVDLLHMRYREDWLEKKYKKEIEKDLNGGDDHSNDGFE